MSKIIIVGGVAGGASAAARLRRLDEHAEIILFERGEHISFANCGLPYYIGGEIKDKAALTVQTPQSFRARFNVDVRVYSEVTAIDRAAKNVSVRSRKTGKTYTESYDKLILSPGAEPIRPNIEGADSDKVFPLRTIPDTLKIKAYIETNRPKSAAVIGGGYIGVEMAENLHTAGLQVTLIEMQDQIIAPLDYDMACDVHRYLERKGVRLILENGVQSIADSGDTLTVTLNDGKLQADMLIMAIGVRPESSLAKASGLAVSERGSIVVSEQMQTSDPDIFAVGDAVEVTDFVTGQKGFVPLAGPANKQGRIAADVICGLNSRYTGTQGSAILKVFDMTAATTGINEKTAKRLGLDYEKSFIYSMSHASYYPGATSMLIKTIFAPSTGKILGAQIVGFEGADKRCDVFATAIRAGMTAFDLTRLELCYAPPYSSAKDPVNMAGYVIENILTGKVKTFYWHDVETLPLDELRSRTGELDQTKPIYATCQSGLRSYIAARILMQRGFEVYNLSGGYRLYRSVVGP
ncbi:MAG: FAD-dependent oxidoreductase [Oscillospiraceae bacterium]|nr:FAD-dependent oxidoreductase [Oscillospiraceae bacterium]